LLAEEDGFLRYDAASPGKRFTTSRVVVLSKRREPLIHWRIISRKNGFLTETDFC